MGGVPPVIDVLLQALMELRGQASRFVDGGGQAGTRQMGLSGHRHRT